MKIAEYERERSKRGGSLELNSDESEKRVNLALSYWLQHVNMLK